MITSVTPNVGFLGREARLLVNGANFSRSVQIRVANQLCNIQSLTQFEASCTINVTTAGRYSVSVKNPQQRVATNLANALLIRQPLRITGLTPDRGPLSGGNLITLSGQGFTSSDRVLVGEGECTAVAANLQGTSLSCVVPSSRVTGRSSIAVRGVESQQAVLENAYLYFSPLSSPEPSISRISPAQFNARANGPMQIRLTTIQGTDFKAPVTVTIGNNVCLVTNQRPNSITCRIPNLPVGDYTVTVRNPDGKEAVKVKGISFR